MRLTIFAGLIMGLSLAIQSAGAHARDKAGHAPVAVHAREVAPWYVASNARHRAGHIELTHAAAASIAMNEVRDPVCCLPVSTIFGIPRCTRLDASAGLMPG